MMLSLLIPGAAAAQGSPICFTSVASLRAAIPTHPNLSKLQPLISATNFTGFVPTPLGQTPADARLTYGNDSITLSLHVVDPRPFFSDFRLSNRPESICLLGTQFYFLDGANGKTFPFSVAGNTLTIQNESYTLTMHPAGTESGGAQTNAVQPSRGSR